jgi:hypothetical protein
VLAGTALAGTVLEATDGLVVDALHGGGLGVRLAVAVHHSFSVSAFVEEHDSGRGRDSVHNDGTDNDQRYD